MAALTAAQLRTLDDFEATWDPVLGGPPTRPYREFLGFALARIAQLGVNPRDVIEYVAACFEIWAGANVISSEEGSA